MHSHTQWLWKRQLFDNVLVLIFESIYVCSLYFTSPILYSNVNLPFLNVHFKIYDRQFCFFFNALLYFRFITLRREAVHCTVMNENPGYHYYYYYYYQVFGWKKRKNIYIHIYMYACVYEYWHRHSTDNPSRCIWHKEKEQYSYMARKWEMF